MIGLDDRLDGADGMLDVAAITEHVKIIHRLAQPLAGAGKLVVASYGENPTTHEKLTPKVEHFEIGAIETMIGAILRLATEKHRNVYCPLSVVREDLGRGKKGEENDVIGSLGIVADFDDEDAAQWAIRLPLPPNYVLETSLGRFQCFYLFDQPHPTSDVKPIARSLKAFAHCDHGTADVSHVWRIPGTLNSPNAKKVAAGRPRPPQQAHLVQPCTGEIAIGDLAAALPKSEHATPNDHDHRDNPGSRSPAAMAGGDGHNRNNENGLSATVARVIRSGDATKWNGDRSRAVFYGACMMVRAGWDDDRIAAVLLDPANGISAHVREQDNSREYALRQARKAREKVEEDWERNEKGLIVASSLRNVRRALRRLDFSAKHDAFANRSLVTIGEARESFLDDAVAERLWLAIEENFHFRPPRDFFETVLRDEARHNSFHPVLDYLSGLQWDGKKRIDTWLFDYGGVPRRDEAYNRYVAAVGRITLVAAVRRLRQPGCKFDEMLVLVSPTQGTDKSTALSVLAVRPEWFTDSIDLGAKDKEAIEQLAGKWIVEIAELRGRRNDIDRIKAFLSRRCDRARLAWGRLPTEMQRQCVFFSNTNDLKFLKDRTGNRRYWPVLDVKFDVAALERDVHQLWAEAAAAEAQGENIRLPKELWAVAEAVQGESLEEEPWVEVLDTALGQLEGKIRSADVWVILGVEPHMRTSQSDNRMGAAMRELGWERKQRRYGHAPEWGYVKGDGQEPISVMRDTTQKCLTVFQGHISRVIVDGAVTEAGEQPVGRKQFFDTPF